MDVVDQYKSQDIINNLAQYFPPGTTDEEILAIYNNPELFEQYMNELKIQYEEMQQKYSVYEECAVPVITQMWDQVYLLLVFCIILRLLSLLKLPRALLNALSLLMGFALLWKFYGHSMIYCVGPALLLILYMHLKKSNGLLMCTIVTTYLLACESFLLDSTEWNKVKGSVMIVSMKIISICFDLENGVINQLPSLDFFGYVFNPASIIFGPFITYKDYEQLFLRSFMSVSWLFNCLRSLFLCILCLLWSSCGTSNYLQKITTFLPQLDGNRWWDAYTEAQAFRFSHYFVSYLSEASCLLMGIGTLTEHNLPNDDKLKEKTQKKSDYIKASSNQRAETPAEKKLIWSRPAAKMLPVEAPRSLVDVVTNWNLPMHYWLKQYIFKSTRKFGVFAAILITYVASSILHGFNFQLSAVLLSIGMFAYIESVFRQALANTFDACVEARRCKKDCVHKYKQWNFAVVSFNLLFSFIAVLNLSYLGCLFDNSGEEEQGYSMAHALNKWKKYSYLNHWLMLAAFLVQRIINSGRLL